MSDISFDNVARFVLNIVIGSFLLAVAPFGVLVMSRFGVAIPEWMLITAKVLAYIFVPVFVVVILGFSMIMSK